MRAARRAPHPHAAVLMKAAEDKNKDISNGLPIPGPGKSLLLPFVVDAKVEVADRGQVELMVGPNAVRVDTAADTAMVEGDERETPGVVLSETPQAVRITAAATEGWLEVWVNGLRVYNNRPPSVAPGAVPVRLTGPGAKATSVRYASLAEGRPAVAPAAASKSAATKPAGTMPPATKPAATPPKTPPKSPATKPAAVPPPTKK